MNFVIFHYKGNPIWYNTDTIVTVGSGMGSCAGYTCIECINDITENVHLVDELVEDVIEKIKESAT